MSELEDARVAVVTDAWSKPAVARGTFLINLMVCPDNGSAFFWKV